MDYQERLAGCGVSAEDAWFIIDDFLADGDKAGLIAYIERLERSRYCSRDVVEEVLSQIGLEKIQPKPC